MKKIWRVGLAFSALYDYCDDVIHGITEYGRQFGPFHFLLDCVGDIDFGAIPKRKDIDGMILQRPGGGLPVNVNPLAGIPIVSVEGEKSQISRWQVLPDDRAVGALVAEEFLQRAFKQFAYCTYLAESELTTQHRSEWDQNRMNGFSDTVRAAGAEPLVYETGVGELGHGESEWTGALAQWLRALPKPVGIMAATDSRARHLLLAADANGIKVPEEVAVIGVNNEKWAKIGSRGISSVELDGFHAGYVAMQLLHKRMEGQDIPPESIRIPPRRLITRQSSDIMVSNDPDVVLALQFISKHAAAGIGVREVVNAVALSRRSLEHRFQESLNRSIMDIIRSVQIQRSKKLLGDEDMPMPRIAKSSGFTSAKSLCEIFHRMTGMTPSAYRAAMQQSSPAELQA